MQFEAELFVLARALLEIRFSKALARRRLLDSHFVYGGEAWEYRVALDMHVYHWTEFTIHYADNAWQAWESAEAFGSSDGALWVPEQFMQDVALDL